MVKKINEFRELQKKKGKKGFSMIELIIVIAIMAILVALIGTQLIPYLDKSREKRDLTTLDSCLTNFQAAVAECEVSLGAGTYETSNFTSIGTNNKNIQSTYETLAGYAVGDLNGLFKSKAAAAGNVQWVVDSKGNITVKKGSLSVSAKDGAKVSGS